MEDVPSMSESKAQMIDRGAGSPKIQKSHIQASRSARCNLDSMRYQPMNHRPANKPIEPERVKSDGERSGHPAIVTSSSRMEPHKVSAILHRRVGAGLTATWLLRGNVNLRSPAEDPRSQPILHQCWAVATWHRLSDGSSGVSLYNQRSRATANTAREIVRPQ